MVIGSAVLVLLALVGSVLGLVHTEAGWRFAKSVALPILNESLFVGELSVGDLSGSLLSRFTLSDVALTDDSGEPAIRVATLTVDWDPWALWSRHVRVDSLDIDRPRVILRTGPDGANLGRLVHTSTAAEEPAPPSAEDPVPSPWRITVEALGLRDARYGQVGVRVRASRIAGFFRMVGTDMAFGVDPVVATARVDGLPQPIPATVSVDATLDPEANLVLRTVSATIADGATVAARGTLGLGPDNRFRVQARVRSDRRTLRDLFELPEDLPVAIDVRASGALGGELPRVRGRADGRAAGFALRARARSRGGRQQAQATVRGRGLDATATATQSRSGAFEAAARVDVRELRDLPVPKSLEWKGAIRVEASARGPSPAGPVAARLNVVARALRFAPVQAGRIRVAGDWTDVRRWSRGRVSVTGRDLVASGVSFAHLEVSAEPAPEPKRVAVRLSADGGDPVEAFDLSAQTTLGMPLELDFEGGFVTADRRWEVAPFRARVTSDRVRLEGLSAMAENSRIAAQVDTAFRPELAGSGEVRVMNLDLSPWAPGVPRLDGGRVDLDFDGRWGPDTGLQVKGDLRSGLRLSGLDAETQVTAQLSGRGRKVRTTARIEGPSLGRVEARARATLPRRFTRPKTWKRVGPRTLRQLALEIETLNLSRLARVVDPGLSGWAGQIDGSLAYERDRSLEANFEGSDLETPVTAAPARFDLHVKANRSETAVGLDATAVDTALLRVEGQIRAGVQDWLNRPADAAKRPAEVRAESRKVPLAALIALAPVPDRFEQPESGVLDLRAEARRVDSRVTATVSSTVSGYRAYLGAPRVDVALAGDLVDRVWSATSSVSGDGLGRLAVRARGRGFAVPSSLDSLDLRLERLEILGLRAFVPFDVPSSGAISGRVVTRNGTRDGLVELSLRSADLGETLAPVGAQVVSRIFPDRVDGSVLVFTRDRPALEATADIQRNPETLLVDPNARITAEVRTVDFPVERLLAETRRTPMSGHLDLGATYAGRLDQVGTASIAFAWNEAKVGTVRFDAFEASAQLDAAGLVAHSTLEETTGGRLQVDLDTRSRDRRGGLPIFRSEARKFDLAFVTGLLSSAVGPAGAVGGKMSGQVVWPRRDARPNGRLAISDLEVLVPGAPGLEKGTLDLNLDATRATLDLRAAAIPKGSLDLHADLKFEEKGPPGFQAEIRSDAVRMLAGVIPIDLTSRITIDGSGPARGAYRIDTDIERMFIGLPDTSMASLHPLDVPKDVVEVQTFGVRPRVWVAPTSTVGEKPRFVATVDTVDPIEFRGIDGFGSAEVGIEVTGYPSGVRVKGKAAVLEGQITLFGRDYRLTKTEVNFRGAQPPNPTLDLELTHEFETATLFVFISGSAQNPKIRFGADPSRYDQSQLLAFFAGLSSPDDPGRPSGDPGGQAAGAAAGVLLGPITKEARKALPFDTLDVNFQSEGGRTAPVVTFGKWLTDSLFVAYTWNAAASARAEEQQQGTLRYRLAPRWVLEVLASLGTQSADLLWTRRF